MIYKNKKKTLKIKTDHFFNSVVSLYIYGAIMWLILYMLATLASKFYELVQKVFLDHNNDSVPLEQLQYDLLHNIAFTIVLVKAYNILMEYAENKHINIKYTLEIAIIAPVVEIVFNYSSYTFPMIIFFGVFSVVMASIYLFFYDKLRLVEEDHKNDHK